MVAIMVVAISIGTFIATNSFSAAERARDGRFIAYNNGTVLDTSTNLMWAAKDNGEDITWQPAKSYCENYHGGGYTNWRMPTQNELAGLYDANKSRPAACNRSHEIHVATELIDITCLNTWTSETPVPTPPTSISPTAYRSGFISPTAATPGHSRCVPSNRLFGHLVLFLWIQITAEHVSFEI